MPSSHFGEKPKDRYNYSFDMSMLDPLQDIVDSNEALHFRNSKGDTIITLRVSSYDKKLFRVKTYGLYPSTNPDEILEQADAFSRFLEFVEVNDIVII